MASTTLLGFGVASTTLLGFGVASTMLFQSRFGWTRPHVEELPEFSMKKILPITSQSRFGWTRVFGRARGGWSTSPLLSKLSGRGLIDVPPSCRSYRSFLYEQKKSTWHVRRADRLSLMHVRRPPSWQKKYSMNTKWTGRGRKGGAGNASRVLGWPQQCSFSPGLGGLESFYEHKKILLRDWA